MSASEGCVHALISIEERAVSDRNANWHNCTAMQPESSIYRAFLQCRLFDSRAALARLLTGISLIVLDLALHAAYGPSDRLHHPALLV